MSRRSIPRTPKKVKRVSKSKPRKKSPAKRAKTATKKRKTQPKKKAKRTRVAKPIAPAKRKSKTKHPSMNIHTPKKVKKAVKKKVSKKVTKRPRKTKREKDLELTVSALRKMIPQALIHNIVAESMAPRFAPLEDRVTAEEIESVQKILQEDLTPEPDSDHDFIPLQPSITDNMAPGIQRAIRLVKLHGARLRNLDPEKLSFWTERNRTVRLIMDVTSIWDVDGNEREYMEQVAELQGKRTRAVYTDLLSPGDLEDIFAESAAE